jgi:hypothetical protein
MAFSQIRAGMVIIGPGSQPHQVEGCEFLRSTTWRADQVLLTVKDLATGAVSRFRALAHDQVEEVGPAELGTEGRGTVPEA